MKSLFEVESMLLKDACLKFKLFANSSLLILKGLPAIAPQPNGQNLFRSLN